MEKLSIIIPVYNSEKYLAKCLDSVISQTYTNLEIIIVNDASTDNSQKIIDDYKIKEPRIISIINGKNSGQGFARNLGLEKVTGNFITFVDSDDWIENTMYEEMMDRLIRNNADVIECNATIINNDTTTLFIKSLIPSFRKKTESVNDYIVHLYKNESCNAVWNKIYKTNILKDNNIKFKDHQIILSEDLFFNLEIMHHVNYLITIDKPFYNYIIRPGSISHQNNFINLEKINNFINIYYKNSNNFDTDFFYFSIILIPFIKYDILNQIQNYKNPIKRGSIIFREIRYDKIIFQIIKNCIRDDRAFYKDRLFCLLITIRMHYIILFWILIFKKNKKNIIKD